MVIYVKGVSANTVENTLYRKNGQISHRTRWTWKLRSPFMLKFGMEIHFRVIQNRTTAVFKISILTMVN